MANQNAFKSENIINAIQIPGMARKGNAGLPIHSKEKRQLILLIIICIILFYFFIFIFIKYAYAPEKAEINNNSVLEVIDGDTFKLWSGEIVRLICVDTPEKGSLGYQEAKDFLSFLILNKEVRLESDVDDKDNYGRLLRYVYVSEDSKEIFVNKEIVQQGYGPVFIYGNNTRRCGEILD